MRLEAPCAVGDVLDRITILTIKLARVSGTAAGNVNREALALRGAWEAAGLSAPESAPEYTELATVNLALWNVEDRLRVLEGASDFGPEFVAAARSVYHLNDRRAALKRAVNVRVGSELVEEKVHVRYGGEHG